MPEPACVECSEPFRPDLGEPDCPGCHLCYDHATGDCPVCGEPDADD